MAASVVDHEPAVTFEPPKTFTPFPNAASQRYSSPTKALTEGTRVPESGGTGPGVVRGLRHSWRQLRPCRGCEDADARGFVWEHPVQAIAQLRDPHEGRLGERRIPGGNERSRERVVQGNQDEPQVSVW